MSRSDRCTQRLWADLDLGPEVAGARGESLHENTHKRNDRKLLLVSGGIFEFHL